MGSTPGNGWPQFSPTKKLQRGTSRREFISVGGLGALGFSLSQLFQAEALAQRVNPGSPRRTAKSCIFIFLDGGPSHIDTLDMKPSAPVEFRGDFRPIATAVPGTSICEHLPAVAQLSRHFSIVRTLCHSNRIHAPAKAWMLTGVDPKTDAPANVRARPDDPPALGSLAANLAPSCLGMTPFVMVPTRLGTGSEVLRGQAGGWLGKKYDPLVVDQDPNARTFGLDYLGQQDKFATDHLTRRRDLWAALDGGPVARELPAREMGELQRRAFEVVTSRKTQAAFDLSAEPDRVRNRYGRNTLGQSCLLSRRLIEAGARLVTVMDCDIDPTIIQYWDTHGKNFPILKDKLLPRLDRAYSALLEDLLVRGLLDDTVVFLGGEFGRTPRVGAFNGVAVDPDGRDHWPNCFSGLLAGGRIRPGIVYGASDSKAAYPARDPVTPENLAATIFAAMALDPETVFYSPDKQPRTAIHGKPVLDLLA